MSRHTVAFSPLAGSQFVTIPSTFVSGFQFDIRAAQGGPSGAALGYGVVTQFGGYGGRVTGSYPVAVGDTIYLYVPEEPTGSTQDTMGHNKGGAGGAGDTSGATIKGSAGGAGAGSCAILDGSTLIAEAGGGGGAGGIDYGPSNHDVRGYTNWGGGYGGAIQGYGKDTWAAYGWTGGGEGGQGSVGGSGATTSGTGGSSQSAGVGGGGGGYAAGSGGGGGGGSGGTSNGLNPGGGGAGGQSAAPNALNPAFFDNYQAGAGAATVSWQARPTVTISTPTESSTNTSNSQQAIAATYSSPDSAPMQAYRIVVYAGSLSTPPNLDGPTLPQALQAYYDSGVVYASGTSINETTALFANGAYTVYVSAQDSAGADSMWSAWAWINWTQSVSGVPPQPTITLTPQPALATVDVTAAIAVTNLVPSYDSDFEPGENATYEQTMAAYVPQVYLPLQETSGTTAADISGSGYNMTYVGGVTNNQTGGPIFGATKAYLFNGSTGYLEGPSTAVAVPTIWTEVCWYKTTAAVSQGLISYESSQTGTSTTADRILALDATGHLTSHVAGCAAIADTTATNDGAWHMAALTYSVANGLELWRDGSFIGSNTGTPSASFSGWWRVGDTTPQSGLGGFFNGEMAHVGMWTGNMIGDAQLGVLFKAQSGGGGGAIYQTNTWYPMNEYQDEVSDQSFYPAFSGSQSLAIVGTGNSYQYVGGYSGLYPVAASTGYTATVMASLEANYGFPNLNLNILWYTAGHVLISTDTSSNFNVVDGHWSQMYNQGTSPSNAAYAQLQVVTVGQVNTLRANPYIFVDAVALGTAIPSYYTVQRSLDGGNTWQTCQGGGQLGAGGGTVTFSDHGAPREREVAYQVQAVGAPGLQNLVSAWSTPQSTYLNSDGNTWLMCGGNATLDFKTNVGLNLQATSHEDQAAYQPEGRSDWVVFHGTIHEEAFVTGIGSNLLTFTFANDADWANFQAIRATQYPCLLKSLYGDTFLEQWWGTLGPDVGTERFGHAGAELPGPGQRPAQVRSSLVSFYQCNEPA